MTWPSVALGEVATIVSGATPKTGVADYWDGGIPWATPKDLSSLKTAAISATPRTITEAGLRSCSATVLPASSVLFSSRAPIGHVAINTVPMATNQGFKSFVPERGKLDAGYLYHWLRAHRPRLESLGNGATFKEVSKAVVSRVEIPLPPIEEQRRIAAILDHADDLRRKHAERLAVLDALEGSHFRQMFGDVGPDSPGAVRLKEVIPSIENGRSPVCESRSRDGREFGVLKLGAVTYGTYRPQENKAYLGSVTAADREVRAGDLLMTRKNTQELVGAVAYVANTPERLLLPDLIFRLKYDNEIVNPIFLQRLLVTGRMRDSIRGLASGSAASMPNISKSRLFELPIPVPPLAIQQTFVTAVEGIEAVRSRATSARAEAIGLLDSLQARAFSGRL